YPNINSRAYCAERELKLQKQSAHHYPSRPPPKLFWRAIFILAMALAQCRLMPILEHQKRHKLAMRWHLRDLMGTTRDTTMNRNGFQFSRLTASPCVATQFTIPPTPVNPPMSLLF